MILVTIVFWGVQPFFMKVALKEFDPFTVSWVRLTFAALVTGLYAVREMRIHVANFRKFPLVLIAGGVSLGINYYLYIKGVEIGGPLTANILIQFGPLVLALVGVFVFKESFTRMQFGAVLVALIGFTLFYFDRMSVANESGLQGEAAITMIFAAIFWVGLLLSPKGCWALRRGDARKSLYLLFCEPHSCLFC